MFIGVQKLELFSEHKLLELGQFLDLTGLQPPSYSRFTRRNSFDVIFWQIQALVADQPGLKVSILTLQETSPVWLRNS